jgi:hypothetical protein
MINRCSLSALRERSALAATWCDHCWSLFGALTAVTYRRSGIQAPLAALYRRMLHIVLYGKANLPLYGGYVA